MNSRVSGTTLLLPYFFYYDGDSRDRDYEPLSLVLSHELAERFKSFFVTRPIQYNFRYRCERFLFFFFPVAPCYEVQLVSYWMHPRRVALFDSFSQEAPGALLPYIILYARVIIFRYKMDIKIEGARCVSSAVSTGRWCGTSDGVTSKRNNRILATFVHRLRLATSDTSSFDATKILLYDRIYGKTRDDFLRFNARDRSPFA